MRPAAFGRLCVETDAVVEVEQVMVQPPSGGCVLKPRLGQPHMHQRQPAAFGRLCVETYRAALTVLYGFQPPSGGCVLKLDACRL